MKRWQDWLDSLSTKGGNVFMLFLALTMLLILMLHVTHDGRDSSVVAVVHDLAVGFGGALLGALAGNSSRQQMADRVETATPSVSGQRLDVQKVDTVNVTQEPVK